MTSNLPPAFMSAPGVSFTPAPQQPSASALANASRMTAIDPIKLLRQNLLSLIVASCICLVLSVLIWSVLRYAYPIYYTESLLIATGSIDRAYDTMQDPASTAADAQGAFILNQIVRLTSDDVLIDALKNPELRQTNWFKRFGSGEGTDADAKRLVNAKEALARGLLKASHIRGSTTIRVTLYGSKPAELNRVLDILINVYLDKLRTEGLNQSTDLRKTFVDERARAADDLTEIQNSIRQFTIENDLPNLQPQFNESQIAYQLIADQEAKLRVSMQAARDSYKAMEAARQERKFSFSAEELATVDRDPAVATRDERIRQFREEREGLLKRLGENHYTIRDIDRKIAATEEERKREAERLLQEREQVQIAEAKRTAESLESQLNGLQPRLDDARKRLRDLSLKLQAYESLAEQRKNILDRRDKSEQVLDELRVRYSRTDVVRIRRQSSATTPKLSFPIWYVTIPGIAVLLTGAFVGYLYLREAMDQRVKSPADVKLLAGIDLLGVLPESSEDPSAPARIESVVQDAPTGIMAESFRQLRTAITTHLDSHNLKTLLIASPQAQGGTSSVASNLAMSMGYVGRRVLLIDTNIRRPHQHYIFGIPPQPGLIEVLRGTATLEQAIFHKVEPAVDILPAGNIADLPPEMLEGDRFHQLLAQLSARYDLVILDSAPALITTDCQAIAKHADALLMVVCANSDKRGMIARMIRQTQGLHAQFLGLVLNRTRASAGGYFRQTYEEFYKYQTQPAPPASTPPAIPVKS